MDLTHIRIENGTPTLITVRAARAEIEAGTTGPTKTLVRTMYGSRSTFHIEYCDGRTVDIRPATEAELAAAQAPRNLRTHTGTVHAPGRYSKRLRTQVPACCASESAVSRFHFLIPTSAPITCTKTACTRAA